MRGAAPHYDPIITVAPGVGETNVRYVYARLLAGCRFSAICDQGVIFGLRHCLYTGSSNKSHSRVVLRVHISACATFAPRVVAKMHEV